MLEQTVLNGASPDKAALSRRALIVPAFLGGQALLVKWAAGEERPPAIPDLARFPARLGDWQKVREDPLDPDVLAQLRADRLLNWTYVQNGGQGGNLFIAWFQSQRGGASQPHSPQLCLPGNGWIPQSTGTIPLETTAGTIPVNRYVVSYGLQRAVTLYWYQTPRRVIANEWAAKFWVVPDAFRYRRTDTALVRVFVWNSGRSDEETIDAAAGFARKVYPIVRALLPR